MSDHKSGKPFSLFASLVLAVGALALYWFTKPDSTPNPPPPSRLSDLGTAPDWSALAAYDGTVSREAFSSLLQEVFTIGESWREYITISEHTATVLKSRDQPDSLHSITFATTESSPSPPRYWRPAHELPPAPSERPLTDLHIALDPGHIGGSYAQLEERWFQIGQGAPVMEGEMVLLVAQLAKPLLENLGATVSLVRTSTEPVTPLRNADFLSHARRKLRQGTPEELRHLSERLFYRTAEIRARAERVNTIIQPDLVICLHFNAEDWGDPANPQLSDTNHFHIILNGAYTPNEIAHDDERFEMLLKILQGTHEEEAAISAASAQAFQDLTKLPPYLYRPDSKRALNIDNNPYLWARNLLANRLYRCPVLFLEPYVMNSHEVYARIQAGDYAGTRLVAGQELPSIFREYAQAVVKGLENYYREARPITGD